MPPGIARPGGRDYPAAVTETLTCCVCQAETASASAETARVRSNVRAFRRQSFTVWRCGTCRSIHAAEEVELDVYYAAYPFFRQKLDWGVRGIYRRLVARLKRAGLTQEHSIIDYGCGSGLLVQFLCEKGFDAAGYDPYSQVHGDPATLDKQYNCVIAQDVIEHADNPSDALDRLDRLAAPGAMIAIGTPNASGIDLADAARHVHPLHQPYHRHIFAIDALTAAADDRAWSLLKYYSTPYTNMPILSLPFLHHYMRTFDGCIDTLFEMPLASAKLWLNPKTYWKLLAGYWQCDDADIVVIFRK